ncbi:MAG: 4-alpha-glucanotransferase [Bifidobacteriaceae bacterium]|nr:4-alpha-glucanotransferase [Bifidobacteriaceae bacterium]
MAPTLSPTVQRLAEAYGIQTFFYDVGGTKRDVSRATVVALLEAFGVDASTPAAAARALATANQREWRTIVPPSVVVRVGTAVDMPVCIPESAAGNLQAWLELDDDPALDGTGGQWQLTRREGEEPTRVIDNETIVRLTFSIPAGVPLGWHTIHARGADGTTARAALVVVPDHLELSSSLAARRAWGLMVQIYAGRSRRSWGLGDFTDLAELAWIAGHERGADFILTNPVHAPEAVPPLTPSPYLPSARAFVNPVYIRPEAIDEFAYAPDDVRDLVHNLAADAGRDNTDPATIDRDRVWPLKSTALEAIFSLPRSAARESQFEAFRKARGRALTVFALWCALQEAGEPPNETAVAASSPEADALAETHAARVEYYAWLQWIADSQLAAAQRRAKESGMRIGLMSDLAVGVHPEGADAWALADVLASGVTVGAPPDAFNQQGQDWSQPPWRPDALAAAGYAPYRAMIRAVLRHAGAIRVDHILGLFRLWWIPDTLGPQQGAYVTFDHEAMVGILALEAHRAGALVVGEDLGVAEPWVHSYLSERGMLGSCVLWFEKMDDGVTPRPPEWYRRLAMTTVTTHDLPPSAAYLSGQHVELRDSLGVLGRPVEAEREAASAEREAVLTLLSSLGLVPRGEPEPPNAQIVLALHRFLLATPSVLLGVSLPDAVGETRAENMPGTDTEYPNWKVPLADGSGLPVLLDDLGANPTFLAVTAAVSGR